MLLNLYQIIYIEFFFFKCSNKQKLENFHTEGKKMHGSVTCNNKYETGAWWA